MKIVSIKSNINKSNKSGFKRKKEFKIEFLKQQQQMFMENNDLDGYWTNTSQKQKATKEERVFIMGAVAYASDPKILIDSPTTKKRFKKFRKKGEEFITFTWC